MKNITKDSEIGVNFLSWWVRNTTSESRVWKQGSEQREIKSELGSDQIMLDQVGQCEKLDLYFKYDRNLLDNSEESSNKKGIDRLLENGVKWFEALMK